MSILSPGRMAAGILSPTRGQVLLDGQTLIENDTKKTTKVQTVFQDQFASLDPRMKVGKAVSEDPITCCVFRCVDTGEESALFEPIQGELPSSLSSPPGCHFAPRCRWASSVCGVGTGARSCTLAVNEIGKWSRS